MSKVYETGPYPGGQIMDMTKSYSLLSHKSNFPGKTESNKSIQICLKYSISISLLFTFMKFV